MPEFMTEWWHGMLAGCVLVFVVWCIHEAVVEYRFERKMDKMLSVHMVRMDNLQWLYLAKNKVRPLFWQQWRMK